MIFRSGRRLTDSVRIGLSAINTSRSHPDLLTLQKTEQHIRCDSTLVRLVQHDHRILRHVGIHQTFTLQHSIGLQARRRISVVRYLDVEGCHAYHVLDLGFGARAILETNRVPDLGSYSTTDFFSHTLLRRPTNASIEKSLIKSIQFDPPWRPRRRRHVEAGCNQSFLVRQSLPLQGTASSASSFPIQYLPRRSRFGSTRRIA
jgi:hypothetical protein